MVMNKMKYGLWIEDNQVGSLETDDPFILEALVHYCIVDEITEE